MVLESYVWRIINQVHTMSVSNQLAPLSLIVRPPHSCNQIRGNMRGPRRRRHQSEVRLSAENLLDNLRKSRVLSKSLQ